MRLLVFLPTFDPKLDVVLTHRNASNTTDGNFRSDMHLLCKESAMGPLRRLMHKLDLTTLETTEDDEAVRPFVTGWHRNAGRSAFLQTHEMRILVCCRYSWAKLQWTTL